MRNGMRTLKATLVAIAGMAVLGGANAQDVFVYEGDDVNDDVVVAPETSPLYVPGPRVYGWAGVVRPEDCGTFKYWNGEYCADARYEPPRE